MTIVRNVLLDVTARSESASASLAELARDIRAIPNSTTFRVGAQGVTPALRDLEAMRKELNSIDRAKVSPQIRAQISTAMAELDAFDARLRAIPNKHVVNVEVRRGILRDLASVERGVVRVTGSLARAAPSARTFSEGLGNAFGVVKQILPVITGLGILLLIKLVPGLLAVGASALSAVGGIGALAVGLAAALGPAVALAVAVVSRLVKVFEALKAQDAAKDDAARKTAEGSKAAATAAESRRSAEEGVRDALQGAERAERDLAEAREQAAQRIDESREAVVDAQRDLVSSADDVRRATVAAYREMEDSAEAVTDAILGIADAQLGIAESNLGVREAEQQLKDFAKTAGVTDSTFASLFKRFTNVDRQLDPAAFRNALSATGLGGEDSLKFERLILGVRRAKLAEKQATDQLGDSNRDLTRAREDDVGFQRQGIAASEGYQSAVKAQEEARRALTTALAANQKLEDKGIEKSPEVIAALDGKRQAEQALARARRQSGSAATAGFDTAQAKAKDLTDRLTGSELAFLNAIKKVRAELTGFFRPAVEAVFGAMTRALERSPKLLNPLRDGFTRLGKAWAYVIDQFSVELIKPGAINGFKRIVDFSGRLTRIIGGDIFLSFAKILGRIALTTLPMLVEMAQNFATSLRSWTKGGGLNRMAGPITKLVTSFRAWWGLAKSLGKALFAIFGVASGEGDGLVEWLTEIVDKFTAWLNTAGGKNAVAKFFADTIPAVKSTLSLLAKLIVVGLQILQFLGPVFQGMADAVAGVVEVVGFLLGVFNDIVSSPIGQAIRYAIGQFLGFGAVTKGIRLLGFVLRYIPKALSLIGTSAPKALGALTSLPGKALGALAGFGGKLLGLFGSAFTRLGTWLATKAIQFAVIGRFIGRKLLSGLRTIGSGLLSGGRWIVSLLWRGLRGAAGLLFNAGKWLITTSLRGLRTMGTAIWNGAKWVVTTLWNGLKKGIGKLTSVGRQLLGGLIQGFVTIGQGAWRAIRGLVDKIVNKVKDFLGIKSPSKVLEGVGQQMLSGLIRGFTSGDITGFIKDQLGGIPGLAADIAKKGLIELPVSLAKGALGLGKKLIPGMAKGGVVTRETVARIGERGKEAVIPLSRSVMRGLARAIAAEMTFGQPALAGSSGTTMAPPSFGGDGLTIEKQYLTLPEPPGGGPFDERHAASQFAKEMRRRGGGS